MVIIVESDFRRKSVKMVESDFRRKSVIFVAPWLWSQDFRDESHRSRFWFTESLNMF